MSEWGIKFIQFTCFNPTFKGGAVAVVGLLALLFSWWMRKYWKEPLSKEFLVFVGVAVFVFLYGLYVLIFQPNWWKLPY